MSSLSIIWNVTNRCPWNCAFCVMDAGINCSRAELSMEDKMKAINHLTGIDCKVDLSGGEVMLNRNDHMPLIKALSKKIGKKHLGISCSGAFIGPQEAVFLAENVSGVEMTMDAVPDRGFTNRPEHYHEIAGQAADHLKRAGVNVGLQTVVTREHLNNPFILDELYAWMHEHQIDEWSLIRYFPAGRGINYPELELSDEENRILVNYVKNLCECGNVPNLDIHYLMPGSGKDSYCRCVKKSIGILPDGSVTACFWGLDIRGNIKDSKFYLGNIRDDTLSNILKSNNAKYWFDYCGKCPL